MTRFCIVTLASIVAFASGTSFAAPLSAPNLAGALLADQRVVQKRLPGARAKRARSHPAGDVRPLVRAATADQERVREPDPRYSLGGMQVYPWSDGSLYRLYGAPEQITDITLQPGEALVSVAAGDTVRWIIGDTTSGSGLDKRTHVLVKPASSGLRTNLVIATDRRVYHVEAVSVPRAGMAGVAWTYPQDGLIALRTSSAGVEAVVAPAMAVEALNFNYRIEGANVNWRPLRAFDDGHQTFVEFPVTLEDGEAPPIFVTGADRKPALVNYRVKGHYYVVDRLFEAAELRLGGKHQQVVRIIRESNRRGRRPA